MSYTDEFLNALAKEEEKKKKKKNGNSSATQTTNKSSGSNYTTEYRKALQKEEDIAPVRTISDGLSILSDHSSQGLGTKYTSHISVEELNRKEAESKAKKNSGLDFFDEGALSAWGDGRADWDDLSALPKAILGTAGDAVVGIGKGALGFAEGAADAISEGIYGVRKLLGEDEDSADMRNYRRNIDHSFTDEWFEDADEATDEWSVLGSSSRGVAEGVGYVGAMMAGGKLLKGLGLGAKGVSAGTKALQGLSAFGSSMTEARSSGATDGEAATHGFTSAAAEVAFESLFGGLGTALNSVGFNKGLLPLDDMAAKAVSKFVKSPTGKNVTEALVKGGFEGIEEVLTGFTQAVSKKMTYMSEEDFGKILEDENLFEQFVVGALTSDIMQIGDVRKANKTGRDLVTGNTKNEQAVIDKVFEDRIAEAEKDGKKLSGKEKSEIYDKVIREMERGYIETDTIEEVLGDRTAYDSLTKEAEEYDTLYNTASGELSKAQQDRLAELDAKNKENPYKDAVKTAKDQYSQSVFEKVKGDRLVESYLNKERVNEDFKADFDKYKGTKHEDAAKQTIENIVQLKPNNTNQVHDFADFLGKLSADTGYVFAFEKDGQARNDFIKVQTQKIAELEAIKNRTADQNAQLATLKDQIAKVQNGELFVNGNISSNTIVLNLDSDKALNRVAGHEIMHSLEKVKSGKQMRDVVFAYAKTKGVDINAEIAKRKQRYAGLENANAEAELVADLVGDYLFSDRDFVMNLSTKHRNIFEKIYDEIKYLCKIATAGSKELRELEKLKKTFEDAYRESAEAGTKADTKTEDSKYSMSGVKANTADNSMLTKAEQMLNEGVDSETVRQETGWYKGYDGQWRFEIDDSELEYYPNGRYDSPDVLRYRELSDKVSKREETEAEFEEFRSLYKSLEDWERSPYRLTDYINHKNLFEAYPELKDVRLKLYDSKDLEALGIDESTGGYYDANANTIVLSKEWNNTEEKAKQTLIHEIQHAIQKIEGFASGASVEYWQNKRQSIADTIKGAKENLDLWLNDIGYSEFVKSSMQEVVKKEKTLDQHWEDCKEFKAKSKYAEQIASCEAELAEYQRMYDEITNGMTAYEQYRNTAGEIEARDAESRLNLTAEQRKNKRPDIDNENVVFANSSKGFSYVGDTNDGRRVYRSDFGDDVSMDDRISEFKSRISTIFNLGAVELKTDVKKIRIKGDKFTEQKNLFGDKMAKPSEMDAKVSSLYDLADILATSKYDPSATTKEPSYENPSLKPKNKAHKDVKYWYKFRNEIVFDGVPYAVTFSIRDKGSEQYQYLIDFKENKTPGLSNTAVKSLLRADQVSYEDNIAPIPENVKTQFSLSDTEGRELSPAVQNRFAKSKVVDENGNLKAVYHGTASGEFTIFDKSKGSVEGDFGSGFYFTDNEYDVSNNYEGGGADFENKVARLAERIEQEEDISYAEAEARARDELYKGSHKFEVYLNIENPAVVGETTLLDYESFAEEYNREDYDSDEDYESDVEYLISDKIDEIIWEVEKNVDVYSTDGLAEILWEAVNEGGIDIEQLKANINNLYLEDSEGNLVGNEVTRQIIESLGYDGIIDPTVSTKWNMDMEDGTTHYIVFKPNQIKSVTNENPTDNPDIHLSLSNKGEEFAPIGKNDFFGRDFRKKSADDIAPIAEDVNPSVENVEADAPVAETVTEEHPVAETADVESLAGGRDSFVSKQAMELYKEITGLKKGVRASQRLGYLLDHGHEWRSIKTALLNIRDNPNQVVNPNSAAESVAREMLGREYDAMVSELAEPSDVAESIRSKMQHIHTEIANNERLREQSNLDYDSEIAEVQAEYDAKKNKNTIVANDLLRRIERLKRMKNTNDANYAKRISDLEARIEKMSKPTYKTAVQRKAKQTEYTNLMENLVGDTSTWVDKKLGISYKVNTLRRNLRDVVRDANGKRDIAKADAIYDELQGNYNHNEANLKRESRRIKAVFAELNLNHAEDTYAHMLGEFRHNPDTKLSEETVKEFYEKHKGKIDTKKVDKAIEESRKTFDELIVRVNERLKEQGMKEIPYRQGYFPHFTNPKQGWLAKLFNWKTVDTEIPTSIAGLTETFNPERSWQGFSKQRKGDTTDYSLEQGLDTYIHGALDWIYHIEDIQKRRALENHIRYIHSEEGVKARVDAINSSEELDADEAQRQIDAVYAEANNPLNNFVTNLRAGTNTLANKKSENDRQIESDTNRKIYSVMTNLNNRISANMVVGSFSSALTNFIPITQSWMEVSPVYSVRGMKDTIKSTIRDDGIVNKSDFLTNRLLNEENLYQTTWDKISDKAAFMMEAIDSFTSQTVWRSKYLQNISEGMSETEAIKNADQFAENVIAGRSRGNQPTIFDAKNPITKIFTAFQLEVNNQYGYMFKDAPQDSKNKARLIKGYATAFLGAYAYNALYSSLVGRDAAFDPISILEDLFRDMGLFGDDDEEEEPKDILLNLTDNILEEVPFVGGLMGGGRIPISSALPYSGEYGGLDAFLTDVSEGNGETITKEMLKPLYYLALPFGGGQIKKTAEGLGMFSDEHPIAGSYTDSGNLRFPVEDTFGNRLQAGLFGQYANENARDYFDNGRSPLKEKQIEEFIDVDIPIRDYWEYREGLADQKTIEDKFDYIAGLDLPVRKKNILINNIVDREENVDLEGYEDFSSYDEFDFATKKPGKYAVSQAVGGYDSYVSYMDALGDIEADKDENGKSISGSKKEKVINYIESLPIDYGQKIILFKSMYDSKEDRNNYNADIVEYLDSREDISYEEMVTILTELGMRVEGNNVYWD